MDLALSSAHRSLEHFGIQLSHLFSHFAALDCDQSHLRQPCFGAYDLLPVWKLALALSPHLDAILDLTIGLAPLFNELSKSVLDDMSSPPPSSPPTSSSPTRNFTKTLRSFEYSVLNRLQNIEHHFDAIITLTRPLAVSTISSVVSTWLECVTSVFDDLRNLIRATDTLLSTAQDSRNKYVPAISSLTRN